MPGLCRPRKHLPACFPTSPRRARAHPRTRKTPQVVAVASQCLCSLARLRPALIVPELSSQAARYLRVLEADLLRHATATSPHRRIYPRFLFTLGTLCRYGAGLLDEHAAEAQVRGLACVASVRRFRRSDPMYRKFQKWVFILVIYYYNQ